MTRDTKDIRKMLDEFSEKLKTSANEFANTVTPKRQLNEIDIRRLIGENTKMALNEEYDGVDDEDKKDSVPYTMQDELMQSITQTAKAQFGADFTKIKNPMLYYPETEDVEVNGLIGTLNDAKFQFRYRDTNGGCYIWVSPLNLNDNTLVTIQKINGVYKNWKQQLSEAEDIKPMSVRNQEQTANPQQEQIPQGMVPGDDMQ